MNSIEIDISAPLLLRRAIIDAVELALTESFGLPDTSNSKAIRWSLKADSLDVALLKSNCGTIVIPFDKEIDARPYFGEVSFACTDSQGKMIKRGRSTALAHKKHPSIGWSQDILYLRPLTKWELERLIVIIKDKLSGKPIKDALPPDEDVALADLGFQGSKRFGSGFLSKARAVYHRDGGCCRMCGRNEKLHIDHVLPRSKGGSDSLENLWLLCETCNLSKSDTF